MSGVLVTMETVVAAFGTRTLLDGVSLGVGTGERIGVVGRNGAGKSTLLKLLAGEAVPDAGRVVQAGSLRVGILAQDDRLSPTMTVRQVVVGDVPDHVWAADPRRRSVLAGLGLLDRLDDTVGQSSGGERRRTALAALLVDDLDLLILDEPTNHLDVEGVAWLASHLVSWRGGLLVATHDRWFLDEVCERVWEVVDGRVDAYEGGYSAYVLARAERARRAEVTESRRQNLLRKELAWLRRGPPARTSKPRFRIDAANALIEDEPPARDALGLRTFAASRLGKDVYDVEDVTLRLGGRTLFENLTWRLGAGDRVGLVGVNGSGKTTLLRLLTGQADPGSGTVRVGKSVRQAMLAQEIRELNPQLRALEAVQEAGQTLDVGRGKQLTAGQLLEQFGLPSARQWTRVGELSGGERRRLQLLRLLMGRPNVLLLDEPTNDLDTDTLTALEDLLDSWPGTMVVVSHDRYFLERTCDTIVALLGDGSLIMLPNGVEEYLSRRRGLVDAADAADARAGTADARADNTSGAPNPLSAGQVRVARKELTRLERALERLGRRETALHAALAQAATDHGRLLALDTELRELVAEKSRTEEAWLAVATDLEDA
ncbi:ABC-F family ATP-binding cassette domain-containing protein [Frankia sp. Cppng1_Ct_nod]|uniref:ABC-F family ATP-binding cassette domain-containing protein n=1 Tax=Frankia sp. Cppng1_Ct_nod TaxID=2897162 RepID=UPI0010419115|nr:ABC-F family ATP-binding cassette domain-containing protein [Frankia sp. Cppng1_Ct_nod]